MKKILLMLSCLMAATAFASPRQNLVVDANWLKAHLNDPDLVLLHVGDKAEYEAAHIAKHVSACAFAAPRPSRSAWSHPLSARRLRTTRGRPP